MDKELQELFERMERQRAQDTVDVLQKRLEALDIVVRNLSGDTVATKLSNTAVGAIYAEIVETYAAKANDLRLLICQLRTE